MTEQGCVWTDVEICCLLAIWNVDAIQNDLNECYRKNLVEQKIAQELKKRQNGSFDHSSSSAPQRWNKSRSEIKMQTTNFTKVE